jgi:hypothetical protein
LFSHWRSAVEQDGTCVPPSTHESTSSWHAQVGAMSPGSRQHTLPVQEPTSVSVEPGAASPQMQSAPLLWQFAGAALQVQLPDDGHWLDPQQRPPPMLSVEHGVVSFPFGFVLDVRVQMQAFDFESHRIGSFSMTPLVPLVPVPGVTTPDVLEDEELLDAALLHGGDAPPLAEVPPLEEADVPPSGAPPEVDELEVVTTGPPEVTSALTPLARSRSE